MTVLGLTCLRNEAPYIVDWIAHHAALGMNHWLIYTHDCEDGSDTLLDALSGTGLVSHEPFTPEPGGKTVQWQALRQMDRHPRLKSCDWAIFFDVDEYLALPEGMPAVKDMIGTAPDADAFALPWRLCGASGQEAYDDRPVTTRFTQAAPRDLHYPLAHLFKSLHRPGSFRQLGVHRPRHKKHKVPDWRLGDGTPMIPPLARDDKAISLYGHPGYDDPALPVLNHYSTRSVHEFLLKRARGLPNHADREIGAEYWAERNWNDLSAGGIVPVADKVAEARAWLMAQPGVADAHAAGVDWHRSQIDKALQDIENVRFAWRLGLLGGSRPPSARAAKEFIRRQVRARGRNG